MKKSIISTYFLLLALASMGLGFSAGIYSNFLRAHGLSELELNLVNTAFFLTIFLFEIPTGAYADVFGRKRSFVISCFLLSAAEFTYAGANSFWGFVTAEVTAGIGITFASGAFQSWFVAQMKHYGHTEKLGRILAWENVVRAGTCAIATGVGGLLADSSYAWPWLAGGTTSLLAGIIGAIIMKEDGFQKRSLTRQNVFTEMQNTTRNSWCYLQSNRDFRFILTLGFILMFAMMAPNMQWQKIFKDHLATNFKVSLLMVIIQLAIMIGGYLSLRFLRLCTNDEKKALIVCQILIGISVMLTVVWNQLPLMLVFFLIHEVFRGIFRPIKDAYLQDRLPDNERATLISFESMYGHLGGALGLVVSGAVATAGGIPAAWAVSGAIMIVVALGLRNHNHKTKR